LSGYDKKGEAKFKDLIGDFTVQETWTKKGIFVKFGGRRALQERSDDHANTEQYDY
jgi:hypothetical protein